MVAVVKSVSALPTPLLPIPTGVSLKLEKNHLSLLFAVCPHAALRKRRF